jgi:hypothetical protein
MDGTHVMKRHFTRFERRRNSAAQVQVGGNGLPAAEQIGFVIGIGLGVKPATV